ncbi:MAG: cytochrome b/b6 domain-containing protein [Gemmatimonadetes bacterium]|nr:cytochrome b/b6 domain-containing protein [Gemmatimonadota bacterium]
MTAPAVRAPRIARQRTYDPVLRVIHGVMALSITVIVAVFALGDLLGDRADGDTVALLHTAAGFILVGALLARLVWGMVGPHEARLARLWHPRVWVEAIRRRQFPHASGFGHHPAASVAYLAFYAAIAYLSVSGIVMAGRNSISARPAGGRRRVRYARWRARWARPMRGRRWWWSASSPRTCSPRCGTSGAMAFPSRRR